MSIGRISTFLDIYFERDIARRPDQRRTGPGDDGRPGHQAAHRPFPAHPGTTSSSPAIRPGFTESIGGVGEDVRWSRSSFRILRTLYNWGPPEPKPHRAVVRNSASGLPKEYCAKVSIDTCSVQYENDELMRRTGATTTASPAASQPCASANGCDSSAPAPICQTMLYANGGRDEISGEQSGRFEQSTVTY